MAGVTWKIQGEEKRKYENIFDSLGPSSGKLSGEKVKPILLNSKLPTDILGQVWELSDIDSDGFLDKDEFCVAMHLVYKALEHEPVPTVLPQNLVPPSKRKPTLIGAVAVLPPLSAASNAALQKSATKITTTNAVSSATLVSGSTPSRVPSQQVSSNLYIKNIVPDIEFDRFSGLFTQKSSPDGFISGSDARDIFVQSGLPQPILAHVWNLCDQKLIGKLNKDQFILAMHFIAQKVKGIDIPAQLPVEIFTSRARDSAFSDSGNLSDSSSSGVGDFSAVRELDALNREIEDLRHEKETLSAEIVEKELIVKRRSNEVQELQITLDRASSSLSQLESDKAEAHTRIDELDQQQLKLDGMIADVRAKVQEETRTIAALQSQIKAQEMANLHQEQEYNQVKQELESLKAEETQLQQTLEIGQQRLNNVTKQVLETQKEINNVKEQIASLTEQRKTVSSNIEQYDKAVAALKNETDATNEQISEFSSPNIATVVKDDPFKFSDPFVAKNEFKTDPFSHSSTFDITVSKTESDPSNVTDSFTSVPDSNANDPFSAKSDPFSETVFQTSAFEKDPFGGADPFSPDSTVSPKNREKSETEPKESFSVDFENFNSSGSLFNESETPSTKTNNFDDPWASLGSAPVSDNAKSNTSDPFGNDAFGSVSSTGFAAFGSSFTPGVNLNNNHSSKDTKGMTEEAQLAWATEQSKQDDERREKMRIQEQLDFEYAMKLSKEM